MAQVKIIKKNQKSPLEQLGNVLNNPALLEKYPHRTDEPWRRFDPAALLSPLTLSAEKGFVSHNVAFTGTAQDESLSKKGFELKPYSQWNQADEVFLQKVKQNLKKFPTTPEAVFFEDLICEKTPDEAFHILRISAKNASAPLLEINPPQKSSPEVAINRFMIYCEAGSEATLSLTKRSALTDFSAIYVYLEKNSILKLRYLDENIDSDTEGNNGVDFFYACQEPYSLFEAGVFITQLRHKKKKFFKNTLEEKANAKCAGIFTAKYSHCDFDFFTEHKGSFSQSNVLFKQALLDETYGIFQADTKIVPQTRGCEGYQSNKNLILGKNSRIDAIPRLHIETENVVASHGSATGEISEDEIFYMMSRGLSQEDAKKLLLRGFFEDILRQAFGSTAGHDAGIKDEEEKPSAEDPEDEALKADTRFLDQIWKNIQTILGMEITEQNK